MASVALPAPNYVPQLPAKVVRGHVLSRAQLETLVHALDATSSDLPGRYRVPERGLSWCRMLMAPFTGAASSSAIRRWQGRQLASILLDQWLRGTAAISGSARAMP
jgi:hypothetical protein